MGKFLYQKITERIVADAVAAGLRAGDKLPTLEELTVRHGVSAAPLRRALRDLCASGKLSSRRGSGYFLTERAFDAEAEGGIAGLDVGAYVPFAPSRKDSALRVGLLDGLPAHRRMWEDVFKAFAARRPRSKVVPTYCCNSQALLAKLREGGGGFDILQLGQRQMLDAVEEDVAAPLPGLDERRLPERLRAMAKGRGVPFVASFPVLLLNKKLLAAAGCPLPRRELSWRDYAELVKSLAAYKRKSGADFFPAVSSMSPFNYLMGAGGSVYDEARNVFEWGRPEVGVFLEELAAIGSRKGCIPTDQEVVNAGGFHKAYGANRIAMLIISDVFLELFEGGWPRDSVVAPFPAAGGRHLYAANFLAVAKGSPLTGLAAEFLDFLLGEVCAGVAASAGHTPLAGTSRSPKTAALGQEMLRNALPVIGFGKDNYDFISDTFSPLADLVRDGVVDAGKAASELASARNGIGETNTKQAVGG